ncbi:MAG TPA: hypothetical protein VGJ13_20800 [Pseudonocardiaceae bacterium]|jgi:hypothetical protein
MTIEHAKIRRVGALAAGVTLLLGGITGLSSGNHLTVSTIGAGLAVIAGLAFLSLSARSKS